MPYLGQRPSKGDENNFKILDDISSYTLTFDGSDASVVSAANETITSLSHRFVQGQRVTYNKGGGSVIAGLSDGVYYIIKHDHHTIKLATSASNATNGIAVNITNVGSGSSHTLNVAFDGINTKFKATHTNGQKAKITRSAQLVISVNGVIQQPHDSATPSTGFGFDLDGTIVLSQAPVAGDVYWAHVLTNNNVTFDISDNDVDNFTGNGSTVSFNLSKTPPDNRNVLVTIDGVVQYPNDPNGTVRAYTVVENVLTFTVAPAADVQIQVRHIGFAGSTSGGGGSGVTNFYGRTGSVTLINTDNITVNDAAITGNATITGNVSATDATFSGDTTVTGNLTVNGTTTTLDTVLTEVDKLEVAANNTTVGVAITQSGTGDILNLYDGSTEVFSVADGGNTTMTGDLTIPDKIIHTGDTNTAIRFPTDDNISFEAGATGEVARFLPTNASSGGPRMGLGTNNPTGMLHIYGANPPFRIQNSNDSANLQIGMWDASNVMFQVSHRPFKLATETSHPIVFHTGGLNNERLRITSSGTVNIGGDYTQTTYKLRVSGTSYLGGVVRVPNGSAAAPAIHFGDSDSGLYGDSSNGVRITAGGSDRIVATSNGVTLPIKATALTSFTLGSQSALSKPLYFADAASVESASILLDNSSQELRIKNGRFSGQITFTTYNTEKLRITSTGNIEVATTTATSPAYLRFNSNRSNADDALGGAYGVWNGNSVAAINFKTGADTTNKDDGRIQFVTYTGGAAHERMMIRENGNIGVNVTDPKSKLHLPVNEDVRVGGQYGGTSQVQNEITYSSGYTGVHWMFESNQSVSWCFDGAMIVNGSGSSSYGSEIVKITIVYSREYGALNSGDTHRNGSSSYNIETLGHDQVGLNPSAGNLSFTEVTDPDGAGSTRSLFKLSWSASGQSVGVVSRLVGNFQWGTASGAGTVEIQDKDGNIYWNSNP